MTPVESLPAAGRELDALVAERVMGWRLILSSEGDYWRPPGETPRGLQYFRIGGADDPDSIRRRGVPRYSTDIAVAWGVVEKLAPTQGFALVYLAHTPNRGFPQWRADFAQGIAEAETAPLAICVAALKAVAP